MIVRFIYRVAKLVIVCVLLSICLHFVDAEAEELTLNQPVTTTLSPSADFFATKHEGNPPFTVQFANTSLGNYSSSLWDFGDGITSTQTSPTHTYTITGTYSVKLTVSGTDGSNTLTKSDLIKVHAFDPVHPDGWDLNFGDVGRLTVDVCGVWYTLTHTVQLQPDGKMLVAVECGNNFENVHLLYVLRYLADGAIDVSFGQNGRIQLPDGRLGVLLTQADGKFIVIGGLTLQRFYENGLVDTTFGVNGVAKAFPTASAESIFVQAMFQSDGKLLAVGTLNKQPILARYDTNGALDSTFNTQGYVLTVISDYNQSLPDSNRFFSLVLQPDGKILTGRTEYRLVDPFNQSYATKAVISRFNGAGGLDITFGNNGMFEMDGWFGRVAMQSNGRILVNVGDVILRLYPTGSIDPSFTVSQGVYLRLVDTNDRILAITGGAPNFDVTRLLADGVTDLTFAKDGKLHEPVFAQGISSLSVHDNQILLGVGLARSGYPGLGFIRYIDDHPAPLPVAKPLTLLYAVLDNNLGADWTRLVNNVEAGVRQNTNVRLMIDGPADNDVNLYNVMQDNNPFCPSPTNPTCDGRYAEGINFWRINNENSAHPDSLYQFLVDGINAFTGTTQINVALIGHGSGWSANVLPGQPSIWRGQNDTLGGMLWDDHPGTGQNESRSLSTLMLGQALTWASLQTGRTIDLLYLDGCSMGMAEVAYEVRESAKLLLASPNIDWASFNYDQLLPEVATLSGQALGKRWLALEAAQLRSTPGYPFTLSLLDLSKMGDIATATQSLADALNSVLPSQRTVISTTFGSSDKFDSNYDGSINTKDAYVDLGDLARQLHLALPNNSALVSATQSLNSALSATVIGKEHENGSPWLFQEQQWSWDHFSGLAIYAPLGQDEVRRQTFYNATNLGLASATSWDEFLTSYWAGNVQASAAMPVCHRTSDGCTGLANPFPLQPLFVTYLPVVRK